MNEKPSSPRIMYSNIGKSEGLKNDEALRLYFSKEICNNSPQFIDYPASPALVRAAVFDIMDTLGIKKKGQ